MRYCFIEAEKVHYPLGILCRVMNVSRIAYHSYASGQSYVLSSKKTVIGEQVTEFFMLTEGAMERGELRHNSSRRACRAGASKLGH